MTNFKLMKKLKLLIYLFGTMSVLLATAVGWVADGGHIDEVKR